MLTKLKEKAAPNCEKEMKIRLRRLACFVTISVKDLSRFLLLDRRQRQTGCQGQLSLFVRVSIEYNSMIRERGVASRELIHAQGHSFLPEREDLCSRFQGISLGRP